MNAYLLRKEVNQKVKNYFWEHMQYSSTDQINDGTNLPLRILRS